MSVCTDPVTSRTHLGAQESGCRAVWCRSIPARFLYSGVGDGGLEVRLYASRFGCERPRVRGRAVPASLSLGSHTRSTASIGLRGVHPPRHQLFTIDYLVFTIGTN
eukprot:scaffold21482_cov55-Phaeocystis_antarctica.AAC.3